MKESNILKQHGRTIVILFLCLLIPLASIWFIVNTVDQDIFYEQKGNHLMTITRVLNTQLGEGGYDEIIAQAGMQDASREEKIATINAALGPITDEVASSSAGLGVGYYSLELDAIVTYGPSAEYQDYVGVAIDVDHPGRQVMATNTADVSIGTMVRGNIMNAMLPVERGGEVIGYIWANELASDLESTLNQLSNIILILVILAYGFMLIIIIVFVRRMLKTEQESKKAVSQALDEAQQRDKLMRIVNEAVASLLTADDDSFETALQNCMEMLGTAFSVDQISIWRLSDPDAPVNENTTYQREAMWLADEAQQSSQIIYGPAELSGFPSLAGWQKKLAARENILLSYGDASQELIDQYSTTGFLALLALPVYLLDSNWGFVLFTDMHQERYRDESEESVLLSGSLLMANAINRNEFTRHLVVAREEALAGTRAKSSFLASMSHEIRTPMNAIIGMVSIGKAAESAERKDYAFDKIETASTHLLDVINDVLDISKIESGKLEISPAPFSFPEMIQRVVDVFSNRMEAKKQIFTIELDPAIPNTLVGDDQRLMQVIINLLSNASKFTAEGGEITLAATLKGRDSLSPIIQVDVKDQGIGIEPEQQDRIFKSFEQAESSTTRKYGGTGLGLAISKNIIELMGGRIWLESEPGKGSTFSFSVPMLSLDDEPVEKPAKRQAVEEEPALTTEFPGKRILLAEDVEVNREIVLALLEPTRLEFDCAENGAEAVLMFKKDPARYDLILMDVQMPEMDGYEATRQIRAMDMPEAKTVPIIATTANVFKEDIEKALESGMDGHVGKPLDLDEVLRVLSTYLS